MGQVHQEDRSVVSNTLEEMFTSYGPKIDILGLYGRKAIERHVNVRQRSSYDEKNVEIALSSWSTDEIQRDLEL